MTQCNTLNLKVSNSQLNSAKPEIKTRTDVTLNLSSNVAGYFNDGTILAHNSSFN